MKSRPTPDIVLIGSSRVMNHFDTQYFAERGHTAFNYGVAALSVWEYPSMVIQASQVAQSAVVISFPAQILFIPLGCPATPTWQDIAFYLRIKTDCLKTWTAHNMLQALPINSLFSETLADIHFFPCKDPSLLPIVNGLAERFAKDYCKDPRKVSFIRGNEERWIIGFQNGDGEILAKTSANWSEQRLDYTAQDFNSEVLTYLRQLADIARAAGKTPIFLIDAAPVNRPVINHSLEQATGVPTIYMNDDVFSPEEIADMDHLGPKGIRRASKELYNRLFGLNGYLSSDRGLAYVDGQHQRQHASAR